MELVFGRIKLKIFLLPFIVVMFPIKQRRASSSNDDLGTEMGRVGEATYVINNDYFLS